MTILLLTLAQEPDVSELIRGLRRENIEERLDAQRALIQLGKPAVAALRPLTDDADLEVAGRARFILEEIEWGKALAALQKHGERLATHAMLRIESPELTRLFPDHRFYVFDAGIGAYRVRYAVRRYEDGAEPITQNNSDGTVENERQKNLDRLVALARAAEVRFKERQTVRDFHAAAQRLTLILWADEEPRIEPTRDGWTVTTSSESWAMTLDAEGRPRALKLNE